MSELSNREATELEAVEATALGAAYLLAHKDGDVGQAIAALNAFWSVGLEGAIGSTLAALAWNAVECETPGAYRDYLLGLARHSEFRAIEIRALAEEAP